MCGYDGPTSSVTYQNPETAAKEKRDLGLLHSMDRSAQIAELEKIIDDQSDMIERLRSYQLALLERLRECEEEEA